MLLPYFIPRKVPYQSVVIIAVLITIYFTPGSFQLLYFNNILVADGQWWRPITSQFVHLDLTHLAYNVSALLVLGWIVEESHSRHFLPILATGVASVAIYLCFSSLWRYCGFSGVISTLVLPAVWFIWLKDRSIFPWVIGTLYLARLLIELWTDTPLVTDLEWPSHPPAHLTGMAAGLLWLVLITGLAKAGIAENRKTRNRKT